MKLVQDKTYARKKMEIDERAIQYLKDMMKRAFQAFEKNTNEGKDFDARFELGYGEGIKQALIIMNVIKE